MAKRTIPLVVFAGVATLLLGGCTPTAAPPSPPPAASAEPIVDETPAPDPVVLPTDAVLGLTAVATATNGATLKILVTVLAPAPWNAGAGTGRAQATATHCDGELDQGIFEATSYSFGQVDISAIADSATGAWPTDLAIQLYPLPSTDGTGPSLTAAGGVEQRQAPDPSGENEPGYYVPHCLQNAFLPGAGSGSTYLGFREDASTRTAWITSSYGITFDGFSGSADASLGQLSECAQIVTPLGISMGVAAGGLPEHFTATSCRIGQ